MSKKSISDFGLECRRSTIARTEAAMGAILSLRSELASESGRDTAYASSAYQNIKGILLDLFEGAYQKGYAEGEDVASMRCAEADQEGK